MSQRCLRPRTLIRGAAAIAAVALISMAGASTGASAFFAGESHAYLPDFDARAGSVEPTAQQEQIAAGMGAEVRWNRFGTPQSLINYDGYLASGLSGDSAASVAQNWISQNRVLFRLSDSGIANLQLLNDQELVGTQAHSVLFRQRFGQLVAAEDGQVAVGVTGDATTGWQIAYVSSSIAGDGGDPGGAALSPEAAWLIAAGNVGRPATSAQISDIVTQFGWTRFEVGGFAYFQRARVRALPTPSGGVRPVYETIVLDFQSGVPTAYTHYIDAQNGDVLYRRNEVQHVDAPETEVFSGDYGPGDCGVSGPFDSPAGTKTATVAAKSTVDANDIVLDLWATSPFVPANHRGHSDTLTSPEVIFADVSIDVHPSPYFVTVCPFTPSDGPDTYEGVIAFQGLTDVPDAFAWPPKWKFFTANPPLAFNEAFPVYDRADTDIRITGCWNTDSDFNTKSVADCQLTLQNLASRVPWDHMVESDTPSFTTTGNNVVSAEAWLAAVGPPQVFGSPVALGPGPTGYQPHSTTRDYIYGFTDRWNNERCAQTAYAPDPSVAPNPASGANDIDAATANLFSEHNRMHDWSYHLGFTEQHYNFQINNFGLTPPSRQFDPEVGSVQAGAVTGAPGPNPQTTYGGRNNANQITLPDGVPGLTNMYLWQPRAAAFYAPCADGDFDMSVIAHEYGHGIQNRMVAGPDNQLSGHQARAMGESWSDLTAIEYLNEYGFVPVEGENPFAVGAYATGNNLRGIRNYGMNQSPLNFSDVEYDNTGAVSPHADGEIWSATNFDIRQALIAKYNALGFPASDMTLQRRCADGQLPADQCPGNRRWAQIFHDAFLLMASGAVSMVDARDAYLAADQLRFGGANQRELWKAFALRGLGRFAASAGATDVQPTPNFESPLENNARITFRARAADESNVPVTNAQIFVGRFEARVTPLADTGSGAEFPLPDTAKFAPGTYEFIAQAPGYGHLRFTRTFTAGQVTTLTLNLSTNFASQAKGGSASGDGGNLSHLIDDTEATNWVSLGAPVAGRQVTVDLAGATPVSINRVQVSAMLRPVMQGDADTNDDPAQPRFSALRQFEIWTCVATVTNANCTLPGGFVRSFTSAADAFPGERPRPVGPELLIRSFTLGSSVSATHVKLVVLTNQCTGGPGFQGEQDSDPLTTTDCEDGSTIDQEVRTAELQVFTSNGGASGGGGRK